jgi:hypothetical protein
MNGTALGFDQLRKGSATFFISSFNVPLRFLPWSLDARVPCESSRGRRVDHVRHVGDGGIPSDTYPIADMPRQQEFPC